MVEKRKKFKRVPAEVPVDSLTPLDISCGSTKCEDELHCFSLKPSSIRKQGREGVCHECGADLIDWTRIHKRDIRDAAFTFSAMKNELIRHVFWHSQIDDKAYDKAIKQGFAKIKSRARKLLRSKVGKLTAWDVKTEVCFKEMCIRFYNQNVEHAQRIVIFGVVVYTIVSFIKSLEN